MNEELQLRFGDGSDSCMGQKMDNLNNVITTEIRSIKIIYNGGIHYSIDLFESLGGEFFVNIWSARSARSMDGFFYHIYEKKHEQFLKHLLDKFKSWGYEVK